MLGFPWMHIHDPQIFWPKKEILYWSQHCLQGTTLMVVQNPEADSGFSAEILKYKDLKEVF